MATPEIESEHWSVSVAKIMASLLILTVQAIASVGLVSIALGILFKIWSWTGLLP